MLIAGCGDLGGRIAGRAQARKEEVVCLVRSAASAQRLDGRGLDARAQDLGAVFAEFLAGRRRLAEVPVEVDERGHRVAWWGFKTAAARVVFPYYQALDRLGLS